MRFIRCFDGNKSLCSPLTIWFSSSLENQGRIILAFPLYAFSSSSIFFWFQLMLLLLSLLLLLLLFATPRRFLGKLYRNNNNCYCKIQVQFRQTFLRQTFAILQQRWKTNNSFSENKVTDTKQERKALFALFSRSFAEQDRRSRIWGATTSFARF